MMKGEGGFTNPQQKGLFTFYREQSIEGASEPAVPFSDQQKHFSERPRRLALPALDRPQLSFVALSPHSIINNDTQKFQPYRTPVVRPTLALDYDSSTKKSEGQSIIHFSFNLGDGTPRKGKRRIVMKSRAKTQAAPTPLLQNYSTPLRHHPMQERLQKEGSVEYFSIKAQPPLKMKAILGASSRQTKKIQGKDIQHSKYSHQLITMAAQQTISNTCESKPKPPPGVRIHEQGQGISFWEYFQERKNHLLGRYKRKRAAQRHPSPVSQSQSKPTLINNHI